MNRIKATAILAVVAVGAGAFWSLVHFAGLEASLLWTGIIAAAAWAIRSSVEQRREHQRLLAERKREHYLQFLEFLAKFIGSTDDKKAPHSNKTKQQSAIPLEEFRMWSLRLTLIGSDEVVSAWNKARFGEVDPNEPLSAMKNWGRLWLAMRKDCGHLDTGLGVTDVLASFVNDIEKSRPYLDS